MSDFPKYIENEKSLSYARAMLTSLDLDLEGITRYAKVLDIGAKDAVIQKAVQYMGGRNVLSVDKTFPQSVKLSGMEIVEAEAGDLVLPPESSDLILVRASAYYYTKTAQETFKVLQNLNRILTKNGEQRVYPARFGHIMQELMDKNENYSNAKSTSPEHRNRIQIDIISSNENIANIQSLEYLESMGIFAKLRENKEPNAKPNFKHYLSIPKF